MNAATTTAKPRHTPPLDSDRLLQAFSSFAGRVAKSNDKELASAGKQLQAEIKNLRKGK